MVIIACLSMVCGLLSARCSAIASQGFAKNLRTMLLEKIQSFSFSNIDRFSTPSLITRATTDVNTVRTTMHQIIRSLTRSPIMLVLATVMAFTISPHLALFFVGTLPVLAITLTIMMRIGQPRFRRMLIKMDELNRAVQENLINSRVVKAFVRGDYESQRFDKTTEDLRQAQLSSARLFTLTGPIQMGIMWTCTVLLLLFGGREIIFHTTGLLTGELVSMVSYGTQAVSSLTMLSSGFKLFRLFRLNKALKALKFLRYSHSFELILNVIKREKRALAAVCVLAGGYIALSALIMFQVEPDSFDTFFDAIYWAVVTLTTVGYGDIYPTSEIGRIVSMMSSFMGIAIVALPTGIITAGYMRELSREKWD